MATEKKGRVDAPNTPKARLARLKMEEEKILDEIRSSAGGGTGDEAKEKTDATETVDEKLDELRRFVLGNRDVVMSILREAGEGNRFERLTDNTVGRTLRREAENAGDALRETFRAVTSKEVQTHFVRMGLEFFLGMEALIRALPLPGIMEDAYAEVDAATVRLSETICENNPNCLYKPKRGTAAERPVDPVVRPSAVRPVDSGVRPAPAQPADEPSVPTRNVRRKRTMTDEGLERIELG